MFSLFSFKPDHFLYGTLNANENFSITFAVMTKKKVTVPLSPLLQKPLPGKLVFKIFENQVKLVVL